MVYVDSRLDGAWQSRARSSGLPSNPSFRIPFSLAYTSVLRSAEEFSRPAPSQCKDAMHCLLSTSLWPHVRRVNEHGLQQLAESRRSVEGALKDGEASLPVITSFALQVFLASSRLLSVNIHLNSFPYARRRLVTVFGKDGF